MTDKEQLARIYESLKGISGLGHLLPYLSSKTDGFVGAMEPGDYIRNDTGKMTAVPIAYDLWYLHYHNNLMEKYIDKPGKADLKHYDYKTYLAENLSFLTDNLTGLKPLKVLTDLAQQFSVYTFIYSVLPNQYTANGIYWINTLAFELWTHGNGAQYASAWAEMSRNGNQGVNDYVGYVSFPIGQMGVMEVISLMQETKLDGYQYTDTDTKKDVLEQKDLPSLQSSPGIFPDMKDSNGNALAGQNYCYGRHLIESAYIEKETPAVEIYSAKIDTYGDVAPKLWMRYWIHKDSKFPVPGEFIGILTRPVAIPPHVWWFQESSPFLYAGNWMETNNLTSGKITQIILEEDREDDGTGNLYYVKIQGCKVIIESSDFYDYQVGDRVAIVKIDSIEKKATKSFTWNDQDYFDETCKETEIDGYIVVPFTFFKQTAKETHL